MKLAEQYDRIQHYFESFDPISIYWTIIFCIWVEYLFELYLCYRQRKMYIESENRLPWELEDELSLEDFERKRLYGLDKNNFTICSEFYGMLVLTILLHFKGFYYGWLLTSPLLPWLPFYPSSWNTEIGRSIIFSMLAMTFNNLVGLPLSVYSTFYLDQKHWLNTQTKAIFVKDLIKKMFASFVITSPIVGILVKIIQVGGPYFFIWLWVFCFVVLLFLMTIYPIIIASAKNIKDTRLEEYTTLPIKNRLVNLSKLVHFRPKQIYVVRENAKSIAISEGIFNKQRILLSHELFSRSSKYPYEFKYTDLEIEAIFAHVLGNWKLNHLSKNIVVSQTNLFFIFVMFAFFHRNPAVFQAFGFPTGENPETPTILGLIIVFQFLLQVYNTAMGYLMNIQSRMFVFQADNFAVNLGRGDSLRSILIKLDRDNVKGFPVTDPIYSAYHDSHPTLLQRITNIDRKKQK